MKRTLRSLITVMLFALLSFYTNNIKAQQDQPAMQTYSKYDFIPGEKPIFFDDFTEVSVGEFPANWNTNATGEVVTNNLVKNFGIEASRLESDGMGKTQPVAPNDSPVNEALNRRVEFIKL